MSDKKYLIVGLGNPGAGYADTRHNVGFQLLDYLVEKVGGEWHKDRFGWRCDIKVKGKSLTLLKPDTYMNLSGKAVAFWMQKSKSSLTKSWLYWMISIFLLEPSGCVKMGVPEAIMD